MPAAHSARARRTLRVLAGTVVLALAAWAGPAGAGNGNGNGNGNGPPPEAGPPPDAGNGSGNGNANGHDDGNGNGNANGPGNGNATGNPHGPSLDLTGDPGPEPGGADVLPGAEPAEPPAEEPAEDGTPVDAEAPELPGDAAPESGPSDGAESDAHAGAAPLPEPGPGPEAKPKPAPSPPMPAPRAQVPPPAPKGPPAPSWTSPAPLAVPSPPQQTREQQVLGRFTANRSDVGVVRGVNGAPGVRVVATAEGRFSLAAAEPFVAGRTPYRVAAWLRTDSPGVTVCLRFMEQTAGKRSRLVRSSETCISPTATWQRFRVEALSVAPGNVLRISAVVYGGFEGASFELSRLKVERKLAGRWTKVRSALVQTRR